MFLIVMAWRKKSGVLKDVFERTVIYEFREGGVRHPLELKDGYNEGRSTVEYRNFSNIVDSFIYKKGINNLSITPNPEFFPKSSVFLKRSFMHDVNADFSLQPTKEHYEKIISSLASTLENSHYGNNARIRVEIPHSVIVGGKTYRFKEHIWNDDDIVKKDFHMPPEILKRKRSAIKECNVDLTKGKGFEKELETHGKIAEAVIMEAEKLGYNVVMKEMKKDDKIVGVQFCVPELPSFKRHDELYAELERQKSFTIQDFIKDKQKGVLNVSPDKKISGFYVIDDKKDKESDLFGYVGNSLLFFDGLEDIAFEEEYTRPATEIILNGLNDLGNAAKSAYNYTGLPKVFSSIHPLRSISKKINEWEKEEKRKEARIYDGMKAAGFVKPKDNGTKFDRCVIILNEDAGGQEETAAEEIRK